MLANAFRCPRDAVGAGWFDEVAVAFADVGKAMRVTGIAELAGFGAGVVFGGLDAFGGFQKRGFLLPQGDAPAKHGLRLILGELRGERREFAAQFRGRLLLGGKLGGLDRAVAMLDAREDGLDGVEVDLGDGIELVVVAFGAAEGEAEEGGAGGIHHVGEFIGALHELEVFVLAFDAVPRAGDDEAGGDVSAAGVASDLLEHEAVVGFVGVEGVDDVVAVAPGVGALVIGFEAGAVGEADDIEPVAGPLFAVVGGVQELIDAVFIGERVGIGFESADVGEGGSEAGDGEVEAAEEGAAICGRGQGEGFLGEFGGDEGVNGERAVSVGWGLNRLEGEVLEAGVGGGGAVGGVFGPDGAGVDPCFDSCDLRGSEGFALGRHALVAGGGDALEEW